MRTGYIGTTEAGRRLGLSKQRIHQLIRDGRLPAQLLGPRMYVLREKDVERLRAEPRRPGRPRKQAPQPGTKGPKTAPPDL